MPTSTPTSTPTLTPTNTPVPTIKPTNTSVPTTSVTPTPVISQNQLPLEEQERYFVYSQGDPKYNYDELFDPDCWSDKAYSTVYPRVINIVEKHRSVNAYVKSDFKREFSPDYSFSMRFTYSSPVTSGNAVCVCLMNGQGDSVDLQLDYSRSSGDHYWKDEAGQGEWQHGDEPYESMIGINLNGDGYRDYAIAEFMPFTIKDAVHNIWFEYDGQAHMFYAYVASYDDNGVAVKPEDPILSCNLDMSEIMHDDHQLYFYCYSETKLQDDDVNYSIHGIELDPYPQIHHERNAIELMKPTNDERVEIGDPVTVSGKISDDISVSEAKIVVKNSNDDVVEDKQIDISSTYSMIAEFDTSKWSDDTYSVIISVTDKDGNIFTKSKKVSVEEQIISINVEKAILENNRIYIIGDIYTKDTDCTIKREYLNYRSGDWKVFAYGSGAVTHTENGARVRLNYIGAQSAKDNPYNFINVKFTVVTKDGYSETVVKRLSLNVEDNGSENTPTPTPENLIEFADEELFADIDDSQFGKEITFVSDILGTVSGTKLDKYTFEVFRSDNSDKPVISSESSSSVENGILGTIDPTMLLNGYYRIVVTAYSDTGSVEDSIDIFIAGKAKVGNFTLSFLDLATGINNFPLEAYRIYDSRMKDEIGDFGYGWTLSYGVPEILMSGELGKGWTTSEPKSSNVLNQNFCWVEKSMHEVCIDWGNGSETRFGLKLTPEFQKIVPMEYGITASMVNISGTKDTLEIIDTQTDLIYQDGALYTANMELFQPKEFILTCADGAKYYFNKDTGLYKFVDKLGKEVAIDKNGIRYTDESGINIEKDELGRIISITDGVDIVSYAYDENGDLASCTDRFGNVTTFTYEDHYLTEINDPTGSNAVRTEYHDDGRIEAVVDAEGHRTTFAHDLENKTEITTDRFGNVSSYIYDDQGNIVSMTDALGNTTTASYDDNGNVLSETDAMGATTTYAYNQDGLLLNITDAVGRTVKASIDKNGNYISVSLDKINLFNITCDKYGYPTKVTNSLGDEITNEYDNNGMLIGSSDKLGEIVRLEHDESGRITKIINALGQVSTITYDEHDNPITKSSIIDGVTYTNHFAYDVYGNITTVEYADGTTETYEYDSFGNNISKTNSYGYKTCYAYDSFGRLICTTYSDGTTENYGYDAENHIVYYVNRFGGKTSYTYDAVGNLKKIMYPSGREASFEYDDCYRLISQTDSRGATTRFEYDSIGRNTAVTDALGNKTAYTYNAFNKIASVTDANGKTYKYSYNNAGDVSRISDPNSHSVGYTYDARGRITASDINGNKTLYSYDNAGRLLSVTDAIGGVTSYEYNGLGNITKVTDNKGNVTEYVYDDCGRCVKVINPLGKIATWTYDELGQVISRSDFGGNKVDYSYSRSGKVLKQSYSDGNFLYSYNEDGQITEVNTPYGTVKYTYNSKGYLESKTDEYGKKITYSYDEHGQYVGLSCDGKSISYDYDLLGRLTGVTDGDGNKTTYTYDKVGNLIRMDYPNGVTTTYTYDSAYQLKTITSKDANGKELNKYSCTLDSNGNKTKVTESKFGRTIEYKYDKLNRLASETVTSNGKKTVTSYAYDVNSNRISMTKDGKVTEYTYNEFNQLIAADDTTYIYDDAGNLMTVERDNKLIAMYEYNCRNQMTKATLLSDSGDVTEEYAYNYLGDRIKKTTNGIETKYVLDYSTGLADILESENPDGYVFYVRGLQLIARSSSEGDQYYLFDLNRSVRNLTDENGVITDKYVFDAFGNKLVHEGESNNEYGFQGEQQDVTGLYNLRARYMDPSTGSFTSMDTYGGTAEDPVSQNKYLFANSNPMTYCDPTGHAATLQSTLVTQAIIGALAGADSYLFEVLISPMDPQENFSVGKLIGSMMFGAAAGALCSLPGFSITIGLLLGVSSIGMGFESIEKGSDILWSEDGNNALGLLYVACGLIQIALGFAICVFSYVEFKTYCNESSGTGGGSGNDNGDSDTTGPDKGDSDTSGSGKGGEGENTGEGNSAGGKGDYAPEDETKPGYENSDDIGTGESGEGNTENKPDINEEEALPSESESFPTETESTYKEDDTLPSESDTASTEPEPKQTEPDPQTIESEPAPETDSPYTGNSGDDYGIGNDNSGVNDGTGNKANDANPTGPSDPNDKPVPEGDSTSELIKPGDKTKRGRVFTGHGAERANERKFTSDIIDSIIDNNAKHRVKEIDDGIVTWRYQDKRGNTVITDEWGEKIVTVYSHPEYVNNGEYIPKGVV